MKRIQSCFIPKYSLEIFRTFNIKLSFSVDWFLMIRKGKFVWQTSNAFGINLMKFVHFGVVEKFIINLSKMKSVRFRKMFNVCMISLAPATWH